MFGVWPSQKYTIKCAAFLSPFAFGLEDRLNVIVTTARVESLSMIWTSWKLERIKVAVKYTARNRVISIFWIPYAVEKKEKSAEK